MRVFYLVVLAGLVLAVNLGAQDKKLPEVRAFSRDAVVADLRWQAPQLQSSQAASVREGKKKRPAFIVGGLALMGAGIALLVNSVEPELTPAECALVSCVDRGRKIDSVQKWTGAGLSITGVWILFHGFKGGG